MNAVRMCLRCGILASLFLSTAQAVPVTRHVSPSGRHTPPYADWINAATNIQAAVDAASPGETVLVAQGSYVLKNQITLSKGITVLSVNGPSVTTIDGNHATRCVYMNHADAVLDGFTVQGGYNPGGFGGGINIVTGGTVRNCVIRDSQARDGGGVAIDNSGLVVNCIVRDNLASDNGSSGYGGGVRLLNGGTVRGCLIVGNTSRNYGGGVNIWTAGLVQSCTIVSNTAPNGAGIRTRSNGLVVNSVIYHNVGLDWQVNGSGYLYTNCCTPSASLLPGSGNISDDPLFVNRAGGDFRLQTGSPCINTGLTEAWMAGAIDLDGRTRVLDGEVDRGAYEVQPLSLFHITATAGANGALSPTGVVELTEGADQAFQILPHPGYVVREVLVDGVSVGAPTTVNFADIRADHTLSATFVPASWRKADFVVTAVALAPSPTTTGQAFTAQVTIRNQGDIAGDAGVLRVFLSQSTTALSATPGVAERAAGTLAVGETKVLTFVGLTAPAVAGTHHFRAFVDAQNVTAEKSEGNNQNSATYILSVVGGSGGGTPSWMKPDFVVDAVVLQPPPAAMGQTFTAQVTIRNKGDLPGDAGVLRVFLSQPTTALPATPGVAERAAGTLAVGETKVLTFDGLMAPVVAGTHHFRAFVDAQNVTAEKSEGNNQKSVTYTFSTATGLAAWDTGYEDLGGGWRRLTWFGDYVSVGGGWYWHLHFGFFSPSAASTPHQIYFYTTDMGWLFTGSTLYPCLFRFQDQTWLWYQRGSTNPRWFMNLRTGLWEQW